MKKVQSKNKINKITLFNFFFFMEYLFKFIIIYIYFIKFKKNN